MIKNFMLRSVAERGLIGIICCVILFVFGKFFLLDHVSVMEDPPLGNTVYILLGSTLSIISVLGIVLILKHLYDYKRKKERKERKRQKHKLFYLKDKNKKEE